MQLVKGIKPSEVFTLRVSNAANPVFWYYDLVETAFGKLIVAGASPSVSYVAFFEKEEDAIELLQKRNKGIELQFLKGGFSSIEDLLNGKKLSQKIMLSIKGTDFQKMVWEELMKIPFGEYVSYGEIAATIGKPGASRAVGTAVGRNPIAYFIPCHRVLAAGGGIGGYYWGTKVKERIMEWERLNSD